MDTFRKWLNKPKADDKSLLARFYHADRSLTAVASELDSFDGRAEPDRCSRLVSRLRQGQDKVLAITNLIMEELLGEDRDPRAFRAKFPEEVLQENLGGQLWFGAECLAAGSSIMNREQESKEMRPLAQAVTKSLGNVRSLLRDQCLRNNVPNSKTLHLDVNDSTTEQLYESLKIFDRLFAEFELRYVSAMVQVKTKQEYEMQELICVLFSETLQRALKIGLLEQDKVDAFDPALMFSIPRLAIISGLVVYPKGPLNMEMSAEQLSEMFRPFRMILIKIRDLLRTLSKSELYQLEKLLCTNEDIHMTVPVGTSSIEAPSPDQQNNNEENAGGEGSKATGGSTVVAATDNNAKHSTAETHPASNPNPPPKRILASTRNRRFPKRSPSISSVSADSPIAPSTPTVSPSPSPTPSHTHSFSSTSSVISTSTTSPVDWTDDDMDDGDLEEDDEDDDGDDDDEKLPPELDIVSADCASGYLIPNTNLGNLLQPQEVPLTGNFIANEDEFANHLLNVDGENDNENDDADADADADLPTTSAAVNGAISGLERMHLTIGCSSDSDSDRLTMKTSNKSIESDATLQSAVGSDDKTTQKHECASSTSNSVPHRRRPHEHNCSLSGVDNNGETKAIAQHNHHHHHHHHHHHNHSHSHTGAHHRSNHSLPQENHYHHHHHHHRRSRSQHSKAKRCSLDGCQTSEEVAITSNESANVVAEATTVTVTVPSTTNNSSVHRDTSSADSTPSSSLSDGDQHEVSLTLKAPGRIKFKSTENLLHRLFVCIAGVADQLQTNFASDLRQILRSVFLMNMSTAQEDLDIPEKTKESELFEFRASENDVIQQSGGSNQSIYSAEEVNPELDNVFNNNGTGTTNRSGNASSNGSGSGSSSGSNSSIGSNTRHSTGAVIERGNTIDLGTSEGSGTHRSNVERSRSLGDQDNHETQTTTASPNSSNGNNHGNRQRLSAYISGRRLSSPSRQHNTSAHTHHHQRNRNNSVGSNSPTSSSSSSSSSSASPSSSERNSPVSERVSTATLLNHNNNNNNNNNNGVSSMSTTTSRTLTTTTTATTTALNGNSTHLSPPAWVPDDKAPRCMSCRTPFTAFRRRHHCRNCGGVFCGVCSNASAPLPKYGLIKAVRVCRDCFARELQSNNNVSAHARVFSQAAAAAAATAAGGS